MYHCAEMSTIPHNATRSTNVSEMSARRSLFRKSSRSNDVSREQESDHEKQSIARHVVRSTSWSIARSIQESHSLNMHLLIGRSKSHSNSIWLRVHEPPPIPTPIENIFRENDRSGLSIVSSAESEENLKFDRVMHKTQDGKTPTMLPSRSSVPGP